MRSSCRRVFLLVHPLGTVLGRGNYSDFFVAYQRCGVGSNNEVYPTFGKHVTLRPGSAVLGVLHHRRSLPDRHGVAGAGPRSARTIPST
jgi:hypothetical protein